jgi:hypothetical protein
MRDAGAVWRAMRARAHLSFPLFRALPAGLRVFTYTDARFAVL